jgi:sugar fermentation stimulation protein A
VIKRYKRFLVDVEMEDGSVITAHCPNSGSMKGCIGPGWKAILSSDFGNKKRKYPYTLEMTNSGSGWIGVHTGRTNGIVADAINHGKIPELSGYTSLRREVKTGDSRVDIVLSGEGRPDCYVEVKSVTLLEGRVYQFPDSVTVRGRKHIKELINLKKNGFRAVNFFLIQRGDGEYFEPAEKIDPRYAGAMKQAMKEGVEFIAYGTRIQPGEIELDRPVPIRVTL